MSLLVIGCGNPLRGDDGVGPFVVGKLSGVQTLVCHQLLPEHSEQIARADRVIIVDAATGDVPGEIHETELQPAEDEAASNMHALSPAGLLALAHALYGNVPPVALFTITGANFDHGQGLSPAVISAADRLLIRLRSL